MIPKDITGNINFMNEEDKKRAEETNKFVEASEDKQTGLISEFIEFIKINKKYWLIPLLIILLLMGLLILSTGSIFAPFIYTLFWGHLILPSEGVKRGDKTLVWFIRLFWTNLMGNQRITIIELYDIMIWLR